MAVSHRFIALAAVAFASTVVVVMSMSHSTVGSRVSAMRPRIRMAPQFRMSSRLQTEGHTRTMMRAQMPKVGESYEVNVEKPIGMSFARGNDGRAYIIKCDPKKGNLDERCEVGDKMTAISASFGDEVWEAENYGQIMYAIRTRNGGLFFRFEKRDGDLGFLEQDNSDKNFKSERNGGNYGVGTREVQMRNYIASKENERGRMEVFNNGLDDYQAGKYEDAIFKFEDVLGMEPPNYVGDNFARITPLYEVAAYNIACCYSKLKQFEAALGALNDALYAGFDDYDKIRNAEGLRELRDAEPKDFQKIVDRYDEPVFDPKLVAGFKNFFGMNKKD